MYQMLFVFFFLFFFLFIVFNEKIFIVFITIIIMIIFSFLNKNNEKYQPNFDFNSSKKFSIKKIKNMIEVTKSKSVITMISKKKKEMIRRL